MSLSVLWRALRWVIVFAWVSTMDDGCAANAKAVVNALAPSAVTSGN